MTEDRRFLENSIFRTIIFYDILGLPLTAFEIHKYLIKNAQPRLARLAYARAKRAESEAEARRAELRIKNDGLEFLDVLEALEKSEFLKKRISGKLGFYFLRGRDRLVDERIEKQKLADLKWKKLARLLTWFQAFPFVKLVLVTGSLAFGNVKPESDFDILIVVKKGRIWTVRFSTTFVFWLLGLRRSEKNTRDKICLNHYLTEDALEIKFQNLYEAQAYARFIPVLESERGFYGKFCSANQWIGDYLAFWPEKFLNAEAADISRQRKIKPGRFLNFISRAKEAILGGKMGDFVEWALKEIQRGHIESHPLKDKAGGRIIADDSELEFHPELHSQKVLDEYERREQLGLTRL